MTIIAHMRKVIAAINMTLDGVCDHTVGIVDEELHQHYSELIKNSGVILYGRVTFHLMQFWQSLLKNPSGDKPMDDFAIDIDKIQKLVFSNTMKDTEWDSARLVHRPPGEVIMELKKQSGNDILVGSRSLIIQLLKLNLIDEFQLCIHPMVAGGGLKLFENINESKVFILKQIRTLPGGQLVIYYEPKYE